MVAFMLASRQPAQAAPARQRRQRRSAGSWAIVGVPIVLGLVFVWQFASNVLHTDTVVRSAVSISRVSLEPDPLGSRVDLVLVDRVGQETNFGGGLTLKVREPDGTVWQSTRSIAPADFVPIQAGGLLAGRVGYSVVIPTSDWQRSPRHGGSATVSVLVEPTDGPSFSTIAEERFP